MDKTVLTLILSAALVASACTEKYDVVIVGGGISGTAAGVQSARMGARTLIVEEGEWLGGMVTSAGVSCIDGNYRMRAGLFGEFTDAMAEHYGGYDKLKTGWVSNINFSPAVAADYFKTLAASTEGLTAMMQTSLVSAKHLGKGWKLSLAGSKETSTKVKARILIDGTELGDVSAMVGLPYRKGFDAKSETGERIALDSPLDVIQDITLVAILKDYGPDADMTIPEPAGYDASRYYNSCENQFSDPTKTDQPLWSPQMMITYGKISGGKYMINWPAHGNDAYIDMIEMTPGERAAAIDSARNITLGFVHFIQKELGMKNLGLADDEFPDGSGIAPIPYHRESRRIKAKVFFTMDAAAEPYSQSQPLYRTGVAVGDYPVDHHHHAYLERNRLPDLRFFPIPSFNVPMGVLIPESMNDMLVAEKSVGVSNLINGSTRLQPVSMQLGQAAGIIAALAVKKGIQPAEVDVREVQQAILDAGGYIMPYLDLTKDNPHFQALQRIGASGIMHGIGKCEGWSNQSWFRAGEPMVEEDIFLEGTPWTRDQLPAIEPGMTREEYAVLLDSTLNPFNSVKVSLSGKSL